MDMHLQPDLSRNERSSAAVALEERHRMFKTAQQASQLKDKNLNRRSFLGYGALATAAALVPGQAQAAVSGASARRERVLSFFHTHTGERLKIAYCCNGQYQPEALAQL